MKSLHCQSWARPVQFSSVQFSSVQFSSSVVFDSLWPHGLQHTRLPCPSPGACSSSFPPTRWCHPTISSSAVPFSSCLQSFLASGSFPVSQFFTSGGQNIGASASASVFQMNIQNWFPLVLTGLIRAFWPKFCLSLYSFLCIIAENQLKTTP